MPRIHLEDEFTGWPGKVGLALIVIVTLGWLSVAITIVYNNFCP